MTTAEIIYTPEEAAKRLHIHKSTLRKHIAVGDIRVMIIGGGKKRQHIRIAESDIRDFEDDRKCQFTAARARPTITTSSRSKVLDFEALRAKHRNAKPKGRKHGSAQR